MTRRTYDLTDQASELARAHHLGAWIRTDRVNSRRESNWLAAGVPLLLICAGAPFLPHVLDGPVISRIVLVVAWIVFLAIGVIATWAGLHFRRLGRLVLHQFADGFVLERTGGGLLPGRYDAVDAELVAYTEPGDSSSEPIDHLAVRLTFPDDTTWSMAEPSYAAVTALTELAERCGTTEPTEMPYIDAIEMLTRESWEPRARPS